MWGVHGYVPAPACAYQQRGEGPRDLRTGRAGGVPARSKSCAKRAAARAARRAVRRADRLSVTARRAAQAAAARPLTQAFLSRGLVHWHAHRGPPAAAPPAGPAAAAAAAAGSAKKRRPKAAAAGPGAAAGAGAGMRAALLATYSQRCQARPWPLLRERAAASLGGIVRHRRLSLGARAVVNPTSSAPSLHARLSYSREAAGGQRRARARSTGCLVLTSM